MQYPLKCTANNVSGSNGLSNPEKTKTIYAVCSMWYVSGADPGLGALTELWCLWTQGLSEGNVPPQKWRKIVIFKVSLYDLVHSFCLGRPHKVRSICSWD